MNNNIVTYRQPFLPTQWPTYSRLLLDAVATSMCRAIFAFLELAKKNEKKRFMQQIVHFFLKTPKSLGVLA